jgi:hypothetical protein
MAQLLVRLLGQIMVIQSQDQLLTDLAYQIEFPKTLVSFKTKGEPQRHPRKHPLLPCTNTNEVDQPLHASVER